MKSAIRWLIHPHTFIGSIIGLLFCAFFFLLQHASVFSESTNPFDTKHRIVFLTDPTVTPIPILSPNPTPFPTATPIPYHTLIVKRLLVYSQIRPQIMSGNTPANTVWDRLAACESGGNWAENTGNGYFGGLQFSEGTWRGVGGSGTPNTASREEQIMRGKILESRRGWSPWPECSRRLGL